MSYTFTLTGQTSELSADITPNIYLGDSEFVLGLTNFNTFYSVPNIDVGCNKFFYGDSDEEITIPTGAYDIGDLDKILRQKIREHEEEKVNSEKGQLNNIPKNKERKSITLRLTANNNTLHTQIKCSERINFTKEGSIAPILGFNKRIIPAHIASESDTKANVLNINAICVECNITTASYKNGRAGHILYQFFPDVPPGYKIVISPSNVIYLPINVNAISNLTVKIVDQEGKLVNFQGETITVGLHLKKII